MIDLTKKTPKLSKPDLDLDLHYNFGSSTLDEDYRDLYWNNVYSVKNYIPRIQKNNSTSTRNYTGLKASNFSNNVNPVPFNKARFRLVFGYRVLCILMTVVIGIIEFLNVMINVLDSALCLPWPIKKCLFNWGCKDFSGGLVEDSDVNIVYVPGCTGKAKKNTKCPSDGKSKCKLVASADELKDKVQQTLAQEYEIINLDFYNDWLNGSLYFPLWSWKKTKKKKFLFGLFRKKAKMHIVDVKKNKGN